MSVPLQLVRRHLAADWLRTILTAGAMAIAVFLFCFLVSIVTTLRAATRDSAGNRLIVESSVSFLVALPAEYRARIASVPGVEHVTTLQYFAGSYRDGRDFFAQFAVDAETFLQQYREDIEIVAGPGDARGEAAPEAAKRAWLADHRAALVGQALADEFGWSVGTTVPLESSTYQKVDGTAWEFNVVGVYRPLRSNTDPRTMFVRFDHLDEAVRGGDATGPDGAFLYAVNIEPGAQPARVAGAIDELFANGPQATRTSTEAAFQAGLMSMMGNLPMFLGSIGGAVVFAVFFSLVNTMLMAARQRLREAGVLKALGFPDTALGLLMVAESLALSLSGAAVGMAAAMAVARPLRSVLGSRFSGFTIAPETLGWAVALPVLIALVAGFGPAISIARLRPTTALRSPG